MFDDLGSLESQTNDEQKSSEEREKPAQSKSNYSALIAGAVFCLLYFPLRDHPWCWPVAIAISYTTLAFGIALWSALNYADDFFGDPRVPEYVATLLLPHTLILIPVTVLAWLWLRAAPLLPHWLTVEGHKGSLWQLCGIAAAVYAAVKEGNWLAAKIKRRLVEPGN